MGSIASKRIIFSSLMLVSFPAILVLISQESWIPLQYVLYIGVLSVTLLSSEIIFFLSAGETSNGIYDIVRLSPLGMPTFVLYKLFFPVIITTLTTVLSAIFMRATIFIVNIDVVIHFSIIDFTLFVGIILLGSIVELLQLICRTSWNIKLHTLFMCPTLFVGISLCYVMVQGYVMTALLMILLLDVCLLLILCKAADSLTLISKRIQLLSTYAKVFPEKRLGANSALLCKEYAFLLRNPYQLLGLFVTLSLFLATFREHMINIYSLNIVLITFAGFPILLFTKQIDVFQVEYNIRISELYCLAKISKFQIFFSKTIPQISISVISQSLLLFVFRLLKVQVSWELIGIVLLATIVSTVLCTTILLTTEQFSGQVKNENLIKCLFSCLFIMTFLFFAITFTLSYT